VLALHYAGYPWEEISAFLEITLPEVIHTLERELQDLAS
jgi:hypothetical protein